MTSDCLLGIDIGTSACKVALYDAEGSPLAEGVAEYPIYYPHPGWAQQDPNLWWGAVKDCLLQLPQANVVGIGIAGQSWSAVMLTNDGGVMCPTPIWMDTRAGSICDILRESLGEDAIFAVCGNPLQPTYTLPKILWYKENMPQIYANADKVLQCNSYIAYCLTGEVTQDVSQGYGLHCFNIHTGEWDDVLCKEMGIRRSLLPDIVPSHRIIGKVTAKAAAACGIREGIPVVAGGLDAACGTLGVGVIDVGQTQEQGGQAGGMSLCLDKSLADRELILGFHVVPGRWLLQGGTVGGGGILRWFEKEFGKPWRDSATAKGTSPFYEMDNMAAKIPAGSEGLIFLPYMAGERSPIWNKDAKGVFYGLDYSKTSGHFVRACMEGVAFSLMHNLAVAERAGAKAERLRAMGGAANSLLWTQIKSDVTGKPIDVPSSDTATTWGAAMLAGVAVGMYNDFDEATDKTVKLHRTHLPASENFEVYNRAFEMYTAIYENLKPLMVAGGKV